MTKNTFTEGGQALCIGAVSVYTAYTMFPGMFGKLLADMLPWMCGLSLITYAFLHLDLDGE